MRGIGRGGGRKLVDKLISVLALGCWLGMALRLGISRGVLTRIRRGAGKSELGLRVGIPPLVIILCLWLSVNVWIIKCRSRADHVRWGISRMSRTGMV
jgi:hypothetical protein